MTDNLQADECDINYKWIYMKYYISIRLYIMMVTFYNQWSSSPPLLQNENKVQVRPG